MMRLAQKIIKTLTECGFPAHRLEVEITENALFANMALAQSIVVSLKNGASAALDEFGSGYSSWRTYVPCRSIGCGLTPTSSAIWQPIPN